MRNEAQNTMRHSAQTCPAFEFMLLPVDESDTCVAHREAVGTLDGALDGWPDGCPDG